MNSLYLLENYYTGSIMKGIKIKQVTVFEITQSTRN